MNGLENILFWFQCPQDGNLIVFDSCMSIFIVSSSVLRSINLKIKVHVQWPEFCLSKSCTWITQGILSIYIKSLFIVFLDKMIVMNVFGNNKYMNICGGYYFGIARTESFMLGFGFSVPKKMTIYFEPLDCSWPLNEKGLNILWEQMLNGQGLVLQTHTVIREGLPNGFEWIIHERWSQSLAFPDDLTATISW